MDLLHTRVNGDRHAGVIGGHTPAPRSIASSPGASHGARSAQPAGRLGGAGLLGVSPGPVRGGAHGWICVAAGRTGVLEPASRSGRLWCLDAARRIVQRHWALGTYTPPGSATERVRQRAARFLPRRASWAVFGAGAVAAGEGREEASSPQARPSASRMRRGHAARIRHPLSQTHGSDRTMTPAKRRDDGWDISQW